MEPSTSRTDGTYCHSNCCTLLYTMCITLFSTLLFLYGFFPLKNQESGIATMENVPNHVEHIRVNKELLYKPLIKKVVIMVIDGLRWDFVNGDIGKAAMPITRGLIRNNSACLLQIKVSPPTVTMPRIKAMMTGSAPTFVDVVFNFGSKSISDDNLLLQAKNQGHKLVFYGDDTWLKLFPGIFERSDGTTSFFVTDYTEVDNNVTRHIDEELSNKDWSFMVLHYLGLDHIGHITGPYSHLIKPKLSEMDGIIGKIEATIMDWRAKDEPTLFVVCGDHGMRDSGGHGGNTPQETLVPFVAIGTSCPRIDDRPIEMAQIDISSTLALMLGIPIPLSNLGSINLHMLGELSTSSKLFDLYYNAKQVFNHFKRLSGYQSTGAYEKYTNAIKLHTAWLETSGSTNDIVDEIVYLYADALRGMRDKLTSSMTKYDLHVMTVAMLLMYQALYIMINGEQGARDVLKKIVQLLLIIAILWMSIDHMWEGASESLLLSNDSNSTSLFAVITIVLFVNSYLIAIRKLSFDRVKKLLEKCETTEWLLTSGTVIHALSFSSSSFVEEEHRTWYFFWTTFCTLLLFLIVRSIVAQSPRYYHYSLEAKICGELFLCLIANAVLRQLNSTGDMYAHLPDIADWLQQQESKINMTVLLVSALVLLVWIGHTYEEMKYKKYSLIIYTSLAVCVYLRHMVTDSVAKLPFYPVSRGINEVHIFWYLILVFLAIALLKLRSVIQKKRENFLSSVLLVVIQSWVMVSAMLHRPYNVVLLPVQILFSIVIQTALKRYGTFSMIVHVHYWLGNVFHFYQGNSNNLSTIDVAAGFVGMESYDPYVTGFFLTLNTYSAPVLAYFTLLYGVASQRRNRISRDYVLDINRRYAVYRLLPLAVYTVVVSIQRYHLFVWSVFSPKLLYEAMYCLSMYLAIFAVNVISFLHDKTNRY